MISASSSKRTIPVPSTIKYSLPDAGFDMQSDNLMKKARDMLVAVHRNEKTMVSLAPLPNDFFEVVQRYLEQLHAELTGSDSLESEIADAISKNIRSVHRRVKEIFVLRMEKIMSYAMTGSSSEEMENATQTDWDAYKALRSLVERYSHDAHRRSGLAKQDGKQAEAATPKESEIAEDKKATVPAPQGEEASSDPEPANNAQPVDPEPDEAPPEKTSVKSPDYPRPPAGQEREHILVHATADIPPFAGRSRTYEMKKGDVAYLPTMIGKILIQRGLAEKVDAQ